MTSTTSDDASVDDVRPMRADARRNYDKLLVAAREVFREHGAEGSLDEVARRAGVGPGTLYRHFPTREDLMDALMRDWTSRIVAASEAAIASGRPPGEMLEAWFASFVGHVRGHRGAAAKLSAAMDDPTSPIHRKCQTMASANARVIDHLAAAGALRDGVEPRQVLRLVTGVATVADQAGDADLDVTPMMRIVAQGILREPASS